MLVTVSLILSMERLSMRIWVSGVGELLVLGINFLLDGFPKFYEKRQVHYTGIA